MLKNLISQGDFALWPQISLVIFFLFFLGVLVFAYRRRAADHYRHMSELVLDEAKPTCGDETWQTKN